MESNQKPLKTGVKLMEIGKMTVFKKYSIKIVLELALTKTMLYNTPFFNFWSSFLAKSSNA